MDSIVFWLIPVILLIVLTILTLAMTSVKPKRETFLEPLGTLVKNWNLARFEGRKSEVERYLETISTLDIGQEWLKTFLHLREGRGRVKTELIYFRPIGFLGCQVVFRLGRRVTPAVFGLGRAGGGEGEGGRKIAKTANTAEKSGYLTFVLGVSSLAKLPRENDLPNISHRLVGELVLEPELDKNFVAKIKGLKTAPRFLTGAPVVWAENIYKEVFGVPVVVSASGPRLNELSPKFAEEELRKAQVIAMADTKLKHWAIRLIAPDSSVMISSQEDDRELPATFINHF